MNTIRIATIVTCHNRCQKTIRSIQALIASINVYNLNAEQKIYVELYLTDDGCTDDTVSEILHKISPKIVVNIIKGSGELYWAGGMRTAWRKALQQKWDYFLLLNDDTIMMPDTFQELFRADTYCWNKFHKRGLCSGITCEPGYPSLTTYGGRVWKNQGAASSTILNATGSVQECDMTNANILLVHNSVVDTIGIFYNGYQHDQADYDYSIIAKKNGYPIVVTANVCGECEYDHPSRTEYLKKLCKMKFSERKEYLAHPLHSSKDYITFIKRTAPKRLLLVKIGRYVNLYFPQLYLLLSKLRGA